MVLKSKMQYKRSEKGEFHEIAERNLNETIALILNYPWNTERHLASIELTCPSVTIEHKNGTFLKVGPYFSNKFSIYYLNEKQKVFFKIAKTLDEVCNYTTKYFEDEITLEGFNRNGFTFNPIRHFETHHFEYTVSTKAATKLFKFPILMIAIITVIALIKYIGEPQNSIFLFLAATMSFIRSFVVR